MLNFMTGGHANYRSVISLATPSAWRKILFAKIERDSNTSLFPNIF